MYPQSFESNYNNPWPLVADDADVEEEERDDEEVIEEEEDDEESIEGDENQETDE